MENGTTPPINNETNHSKSGGLSVICKSIELCGLLSTMNEIRAVYPGGQRPPGGTVHLVKL